MRAERVLVVLAFFLTRLVLSWMADGLTTYPVQWVDGDVFLYAQDARAVLGGAVPYTDIDLEYPPGSLPSILVPALSESVLPYRTGFIGFSLVVDAVGFSALLSLRRRWGGIAGAWLWVIAVPLLGPIVYLRFDLVPAVATILALERVAAGALGSGGGWLGIGAVAKIYPGMLALPVFAATRSVRLLVGAAIAAVVPIVALVAYGGFGTLGGLITDVGGYHTARGIQVESSWASVLFIASQLDLVADVTTVYNFQSHQVEAPVATLVGNIATVAALAALIGGTLLSWRAGDRIDRDRAAALGAFATLAMLLATGSVYSTQYTLWLVALGAVIACLADNPLRIPIALLPLVALLSQVGYPFRYAYLLVIERNAVVLVAARNLLVTLIAIWAVVVLVRLPRPAAVREPAREPEPAAVG